MQGDHFIYKKKKKKRQSKYNGENMYIVVEKQSSIKSKKQTLPTPSQEHLTINSLQPEISFLPRS